MIRDTPATIAHDMIAEIGRADALCYLARLLTWRDARPVLTLIWAVLVA